MNFIFFKLPIIRRPKMLLTTLHYSQCSKCTNRTMQSVYATVRSAHLCAAEMQSISKTDAAATLAE